MGSSVLADLSVGGRIAPIRARYLRIVSFTAPLGLGEDRVEEMCTARWGFDGGAVSKEMGSWIS